MLQSSVPAAAIVLLPSFRSGSEVDWRASSASWAAFHSPSDSWAAFPIVTSPPHRRAAADLLPSLTDSIVGRPKPPRGRRGTVMGPKENIESARRAEGVWDLSETTTSSREMAMDLDDVADLLAARGGGGGGGTTSSDSQSGEAATVIQEGSEEEEEEEAYRHPREASSWCTPRQQDREDPSAACGGPPATPCPAHSPFRIPLPLPPPGPPPVNDEEEEEEEEEGRGGGGEGVGLPRVFVPTEPSVARVLASAYRSPLSGSMPFPLSFPRGVCTLPAPTDPVLVRRNPVGPQHASALDDIQRRVLSAPHPVAQVRPAAQHRRKPHNGTKKISLVRGLGLGGLQRGMERKQYVWPLFSVVFFVVLCISSLFEVCYY
eukprot:gene6333-4560_t